MVKSAFRLTMALAQNLLEFTSGYSFCDINRVLRIKIALNCGIGDTLLQEVAFQSRKPDDNGSSGWIYRNFGLSSLKKRGYI
jgi:hypothetical protein